MKLHMVCNRDPTSNSESIKHQAAMPIPDITGTKDLDRLSMLMSTNGQVKLLAVSELVS